METAISLVLTEMGGILTIKSTASVQIFMAQIASKSRVKPEHTLLSKIGNTPLIRLSKLDDDLPGVELFAKAEFFNPGGSV